jgi:hypothetical protein
MDIPVIVGLNGTNQDAFDSFADGIAFDLAADPARFDDWLTSVSKPSDKRA